MSTRTRRRIPRPASPDPIRVRNNTSSQEDTTPVTVPQKTIVKKNETVMGNLVFEDSSDLNSDSDSIKDIPNSNKGGDGKFIELSSDGSDDEHTPVIIHKRPATPSIPQIPQTPNTKRQAQPTLRSRSRQKPIARSVTPSLSISEPFSIIYDKSDDEGAVENSDHESVSSTSHSKNSESSSKKHGTKILSKKTGWKYSTFNFLRSKHMFGDNNYRVVENEHTSYFTTSDKDPFLGLMFKLSYRGVDSNKLVGILRKHQLNKRYTLCKPTPPYEELMGVYHYSNESLRARQMIVAIQTGTPVNPNNKENNLSRLARAQAIKLMTPQRRSSVSEETTTEEDSSIVYINTVLPKRTENGILKLSFPGAYVITSIKNYIFKDKNEQYTYMIFKQTKDLMCIRYSAPFTELMAFALAVAALDGNP